MDDYSLIISPSGAKQVASAVGEGATAALMIRHYLEEHGAKAKATM